MCASGPTWRDSLSKRIILDNGAYEIKYSAASELKPQKIYNAVGKDKKTRAVYAGNKLFEELENGHSNMQITYPIIRGLLHDSDLETVIWKQIFSKFKKMEERASCLALTLPPVLPDIVQNRLAEIVFEDFEFDGLFMSSTHSMIREAAMIEHPVNLGGGAPSQQCEYVVDSGFSYTYGVPFFNGRPLKYAATRIDVGGKLLTNLLNEIISYKEINLQGETHLVNDIKEQLCYVSTSFNEQLEICKQMLNPIAKEYVLPDYKNNKRGQIRDPVVFQQLPPDQEQINTNTNQRAPQLQAIKISNERFSVPEVLFTPQDIGINEAGLPEMIQQSVNKCPKVMERQLYQNIIVSGGNAMFTGFRDRLYQDMQSLKPDGSEVQIYELQNPITSAWKGLRQFCQNKNNFEEYVVTRKEYQEEGFRVLKKFYL
ncbi:UNKNOWN [Stylonychia lemnae]|uniref:Uncharacterized protein n=1 Tax=Stylonychia lemnae TaxID=5949 RepID=A0A077ZRQ2_STYLE|nr:UNKNOWN [Stylonychia lemnae]|eukprot:CDW72015.1 UNKNOWN [Stylonychia lemnae]